MSNTSLADSYLKLSGLDSALSKLVSEFAAAQLQSLGARRKFPEKFIGYFSVLFICYITVGF